MSRGYYGIAFYEPKFIENIGTAMRSALCFGADFIIIIGGRYNRSAMDTTKTERHIPIFNFSTMKDFEKHIPENCDIVAVEVDGDIDLKDFKHPERAIYLFGGEDRTLPKIRAKRVKIDTKHCLNMAVTAVVVMYDRTKK